MTRPSPNISSSERGAAVIEMLASVIVLVTLVCGCVAVSMAFYTHEVLVEYARDASRYAIVHGNGCQEAAHSDASCSISTGSTANTALKTYLNHEIYPGINGRNLSISTAYAHGPGAAACNATDCNGSGDQVTVTISYPYLYAVPFVPQRSFTMYARSTMVISQ